MSESVSVSLETVLNELKTLAILNFKPPTSEEELADSLIELEKIKLFYNKVLELEAAPLLLVMSSLLALCQVIGNMDGDPVVALQTVPNLPEELQEAVFKLLKMSGTIKEEN